MLNDTKCKAARPKDKPYRILDAKGLYLEVRPNGSKHWRYRFELTRNGERQESVFAIGEYAQVPPGESPDQSIARRAGGRFTLAEAREERVKARALVKQGVNPAHQRQQDRVKREHERSITFESVAVEWIGRQPWEQVTKDRRLSMLRRVAFPTIGVLPVKEVTSAMILGLLQNAATDNGPTVAHEAKRTIAAIFELAVETYRCEVNPVRRWREALPKNKTQHKRALEPAEIGELLRAVDGHGSRHETIAAFKLMWLTLCRPTEAAEAKWNEFDLAVGLWRIPASRMKKRVAHCVPLPRQAIDILRAIQAITGHSEFCFPNRDDRRRPMTAASFRQMGHVLGWAGRFSPHATRTTGSTRLHRMGFHSDWIERQLAHADTNAVRATYNHADYLDERSGMMQQWADFLDACKSGADVIPLKRSAA